MTDQPQHPLQRMTDTRLAEIAELREHIRSQAGNKGWNSYHEELWLGLKAERERRSQNTAKYICALDAINKKSAKIGELETQIKAYGYRRRP
jgi:hypothetical protein